MRALPFDCFLRSPAGGGARASGGSHHGSLSPRHSAVTTHVGRRRVSTDLILGAPALPGAHHAILRGFSSSCLSIEAQVREVQLDWFLRNPAGGAHALPGGLAVGHFVLATPPSPPPLARRRVSTDLILGAPAPSPAHHAIFRGFSWSCLSNRAQVRELPFDRFLRTPAGGGAGAPRGSHHGSLSPRHDAVTTHLGIGAKSGGSGTAGRDAR